MSIHISIAGIAGRMGGELLRQAQEANDITIIGGSVSPGSCPETGATIQVSSNPSEALADAQVWIDFTTPAATLAALERFAKHTRPQAAIIGTTGFSPQQEEQISRHARNLTIVKEGNFSVGAAVLCLLVEQASHQLGPEWDIDILDTHHAQKRDAPSGTALMLAKAAAAGRGVSMEILPPYSSTHSHRSSGGIGFAVRRAGTIIGDHEALLAGNGESVSLRHVAHDRGVFARGALDAARWALDKPAGLYSMRDILR